MQALTLQTVFKAIDKLSSPVQGMTKAMQKFSESGQGAMARLERRFRSTGQTANTAFEKMTGGYSGAVIASSIGLATIGITKFITEASRVEDATARFQPLLGSVEKASLFVEKLNKVAAETPYQFNNVADAAGSLLPALNGDMDEAIRRFKMLGDTAGGNVMKLESITRGYNKALLKGKVDMESLNMIAEAGVPIFPALAKAMGFSEKSMGKFFKAVSKGDVSTEMLTKTFESMTSKGGMYFRGMEIASQTLTGKISSLLDNINLAAGAIGTAMLPMLKEYTDKAMMAAQKVMEWAQNNKELIKTKIENFVNGIAKAVRFLSDNFDKIVTIAKVYLGTLIALKTISIISAVATNAMAISLGAYNLVLGITGALSGTASIAIGRSSIALGAYNVVTKIAAAAQWLLNAAMSANPIGATVAALGILIGFTILIVKKWNDWGAAVALTFAIISPGLMFIISLVQSFRRNWDMISDAFKNGGILAGFKAIGATILDAILMPLQQVFKLLSNVPGVGKFAQKAVDGIEAFRKDLGVNISTDESGAALPSKQLVNPEATRNESLKQIISTQKQNVAIDINDNTGKAKVKSDNNVVPVRLSSTTKYGSF